jgi:hypothetical protein
VKRLHLLLLIVVTGCPRFDEVNVPCQSSESCPAGYGCNLDGICQKGISDAVPEPNPVTVMVTVLPAGAMVIAGSTQQYVATIDGGTADVTWSVDGLGGISSSGLYTAPTFISAPVSATIIATAGQSVGYATVNLLPTPTAPAPVVTSVTPSSVPLNSADTLISVAGSSFDESSTAFIDSVLLSTTFVSETSLTAVIPATALANGRLANIEVRNSAAVSNRVNFSVVNPGPIVTSLSPPSILAGSGMVTLTIRGTGFVAGALARLAGVALTTTVISDQQLEAIVPSALTVASGSGPVTVNNPSPGGVGQNSVSFTVDRSIRTLVGGYSAAGATATAANLRYVPSTAISASGELYLSDYHRNRIFRIDSTGKLVLVAGTGQCGKSGDGGPAVNAAFCHPGHLVFDATGNLFVADHDNSVIRRISPTGIVSTVAGQGSCSVSGNGGPAISANLGLPWALAFGPSGSLYMSSSGCGLSGIRKIAPNGVITAVLGNDSVTSTGDDGPAAAATTSIIEALAVSASEEIYFAGGWDNLVRKINPQGNVVRVAGTGLYDNSGDDGPAVSATLAYPRALAFDRGGNLLIGHGEDGQVRSVTPAGIITTIAGQGTVPAMEVDDGTPAFEANILGVSALSTDLAGTIFVTSAYERFGSRVRKFDGSVPAPSRLITTVAGSSAVSTVPSTLAVHCPGATTFDAVGNLYFSDRCLGVIYKLDVSGAVSVVAGLGRQGKSGIGGPARQALLNEVFGLVAELDGTLYFTDRKNGYVGKISSNGTLSVLAGNVAFPPGCPAAAPTTIPPRSLSIDLISSGGRRRLQ